MHAWDLDAVCEWSFTSSETVLCVELCYQIFSGARVSFSKSLSTSSVLVWSCATASISEGLIIMGQKQAAGFIRQRGEFVKSEIF